LRARYVRSESSAARFGKTNRVSGRAHVRGYPGKLERDFWDKPLWLLKEKILL